MFSVPVLVPLPLPWEGHQRADAAPVNRGTTVLFSNTKQTPPRRP